MKNLKKIKRNQMKNIAGAGNETCPTAFPSCDEWCYKWTDWQRKNCPLGTAEQCACMGPH